MNLPVNTKQFWKDRLEIAKKNGKIHFSVYLCNLKAWKDIENAHKDIFDKEIKSTDKVLDAGCGYGRMAQFFSDGNYTGVDISTDLLTVAREDYPSHSFIETSLDSLPFKDKEFDVAFCISIKAMIANNLGEEIWLNIENELKRVAKKVLILEYGDVSDYKNYEILTS